MHGGGNLEEHEEMNEEDEMDEMDDNDGMMQQQQQHDEMRWAHREDAAAFSRNGLELSCPK